MITAAVPVTFLAGYLGAGKTTLLNRLLATTTARLAVMVNDFGQINVDAALVADHDGSSITLTNGCVCCSLAGGFGEAIEAVRAMCESGARPDHVVVELSGVADPARMVPWAMLPGFVPAGVVTLADAEQVEELTTRRFVGDTVVVQLRAADVVVLTKSELTVDGGTAATGAVRALVGDRIPVVDARRVDVVDLLSVTVHDRATAATTHEHDDPHTTRTIDVAGLTLASGPARWRQGLVATGAASTTLPSW